jgi:hypothetical protein
MANGGYTILTLKHIAADMEVSLPIRVNSFTQDTKPSFASTQVYARMDPIFTYQNTVRTFQLNCQTILHTEITKGDLPIAVNSKAKDINETYGDSGDAQGYGSFIGSALSTIYQFMYPVYQKEKHGSGADEFVTHQLKGPPILQIQVPNVLSPGGSDKESYVFVPEDFSVNTGLPKAGDVQITLTSPSDLKYMVPVGGYGFSIGGTILHQEDPPGFIYEVGGVMKFSKNKFPLGTDATYNATSILKKTP